MASEPATGLISNHVAQSLAAFEAINAVQILEHEESQSVCIKIIRDQFSKFKLWVGNIGAHRTGRSSLDYRLRDSSHLRSQVMRLLGDLVSSLNDVLSILSGETIPWDQDPGETGELDSELEDLLLNEDFEFDSELDQLAKEIIDVVGNLLRLSISLRHPAPHDRFMSTEYANMHYFEATDKAHVEAKFPRTSPTLKTRLGQSLSQRRQYFRYRKSHHQKLTHGLFDSSWSEAGAQTTVASSIPIAKEISEGTPLFGEIDEDEGSDTGFSQTSFATTDPESDRLRIPPLPKRAYDGPLECPFCFMLISVSSTHQWKRHVLRDLRPYICLVEDCSEAGREYGRRHEWINHMFQRHWLLWACPYECGWDSTTEISLRHHINKSHGPKTEMELNAITARCGRTQSVSPSTPVNCPFCQEVLESARQYQRHVGRHQVDLALFALPRIEELEEQKEDRDSISTHSGSYSEAMSDDIPLGVLPDTFTESYNSSDKSNREQSGNENNDQNTAQNSFKRRRPSSGDSSTSSGQNSSGRPVIRHSGVGSGKTEEPDTVSLEVVEKPDVNDQKGKVLSMPVNIGYNLPYTGERHPIPTTSKRSRSHKRHSYSQSDPLIDELYRHLRERVANISANQEAVAGVIADLPDTVEGLGEFLHGATQLGIGESLGSESVRELWDDDSFEADLLRKKIRDSLSDDNLRKTIDILKREWEPKEP